MKLIKKLNTRYMTAKSKRKRRFGLFYCPKCRINREMQIDNGANAECCRWCANVIYGGSISKDDQ